MRKTLNSTLGKLGQIIKRPGEKDTPDELQKRLDELSILNKMSIALSSGQDLYHLLRLLLEELKNLFIMDEFYIGIYNSETAMVNFPIYFKDEQFIEINPRNLHDQPGLTGAVIFSEKTLYIPDQADPEVIERYKPLNAGQRRSRSYIGIPLMLNNTVIGVLSVQSEQLNIYTPQQIQLLETIAAQSAMAIEKARLFSELQDELEQRKKLIAELEIKNAETETLRESASIVTATLEKSEAVDLILQQLERVVPYNSASVQLINDDKLEIVRGKGLNHDVENTSWKFDINENDPAYPILRQNAQYVLYDDVQVVTDVFKEFPHNHIHAWMAVPLKIKNKILGIIALDGHNIGQFTERHAKLAVTFANQVAIALENAQLFSKLQNELIEHKQVEEALRQAEFRYRTLIEQIPPIIFISGRDQYIGVTYISPRIESLGFSQEEWIADPELWLRQIHPDDQARVLDEIEEIKRSKEPFKSEYRLRTHEGIAKWFLEESVHVRDDNGNFLFLQGFMLDIDERKRAEEAIRQRESILGAIAFAAEQFFKTTDWRVNINIVLEHLGKAIECTHVYIFENFMTLDNKPASRMTYEWTASGFHSDLGDEMYQKVLLQEHKRGLDDYWYKVLSNNEPFVGSSTTLPENEREYLSARDIKALVDVPIFVNDKWWGIIGFDEMVKEREWSAAELDALKVASDVFGAAIQRQQNEEEIYHINSELEQRVEQRTAQLQEANLNLNQEKARLEQYTRQREIMADMTDLLQASLTMEEASNVISTHLKLLFPNRDGALYLITPSNTFEPGAIWGEKKSLDMIYTTNECWGLRRGKSYQFGIGSPNPPCDHVGREIPQYALCIPFSAQGESLGNLHISTQNNQDVEFITDEEQKFIETIADSIALAIANLRLRDKLHNQAIRDPLTGLFNRRFMEETLDREVHRAKRANHPLSVIMLEIDNFRIYNNTYGHEAGDYVIKKLGDAIRTILRRSDFPCRYGGDEFTIILPETIIENAAQKAEELRKTVQALALRYNNQALGAITLSMGVAAFPQHGETGETVLKMADAASYKAKDAGKNCVVVSE